MWQLLLNLKNQEVVDGHLNIKPVLQYRWRLRNTEGNSVLVYYGIRNFPNQNNGVIKISDDIAGVIADFDSEKTLQDIIGDLVQIKDKMVVAELAELLDQHIIVDRKDRKSPTTLEDKMTCVRCVNDDYIIPGLEFNEQGMCALCQCYDHAGAAELDSNIILEEEILALAKKNNRSLYDVMVMFTGGKDSSYILWYLARKLGLRVLAVTWNVPYMTDSSRQNIHSAMKNLPEVDFIKRTVSWNIIKEAMRNQLYLNGSPCFCYILAVVLFYPLAVQEKIPLIVSGVEQVQLSSLAQMVKGKKTTVPTELDMQSININRLRMIAHPSFKEDFKWKTELLKGLFFIKESLSPLYKTFLDVVDNSEYVDLPEIRSMGSNKIYGSWQNVIDLLEKEIGWKMPCGQQRKLHTSCKLEVVKDFTQYNRFKNMKTTYFPQSIVEISAAVYYGLISREEGLRELSETGYYEFPHSLKGLLEDLEITDESVTSEQGEIFYALKNCECGC